jgi:hypothetical protein
MDKSTQWKRGRKGCYYAAVRKDNDELLPETVRPVKKDVEQFVRGQVGGSAIISRVRTIRVFVSEARNG